MVFGYAREQHQDIVSEQSWRARCCQYLLCTERQIVSRMASLEQEGLGVPRVWIGGAFACCAGCTCVVSWAEMFAWGGQRVHPSSNHRTREEP
jgi:hypothetical protein